MLGAAVSFFFVFFEQVTVKHAPSFDSRLICRLPGVTDASGSFVAKQNIILYWLTYENNILFIFNYLKVYQETTG